jgi:ELWxxDGT repeat protein
MTLRPPLCLLAALLVAASLLPGSAHAAVSPVLGFSAPVRLSEPGPEITPDSGNENLNELTVAVGDAVAFVSNIGNEPALWLSDGTQQGTRPLRTFRGSYGPIAAFHDAIFFVADDGEHGYELWRSDGTTAGTQLVRDIGPNSSINEHTLAACSYKAPELVAWRDRLYFAADDGEHGSELWASDGTTAGTQLVADSSDGRNGSYPMRLIGLPNALLFVAWDTTHGYELWRSDGTRDGTTLVRDIAPDAASGQLRLWSVPGSVLCPVRAELADGIQAGDGLLFTARDGERGFELWTSDGTAAGTQLVSDLVPGAGSSTPDSLVGVGGQIMFRAADAQGNVSLWAVRAQPYQQLLPLVRR